MGTRRELSHQRQPPSVWSTLFTKPVLAQCGEIPDSDAAIKEFPPLLRFHIHAHAHALPDQQTKAGYSKRVIPVKSAPILTDPIPAVPDAELVSSAPQTSSPRGEQPASSRAPVRRGDTFHPSSLEAAPFNPGTQHELCCSQLLAPTQGWRHRPGPTGAPR